MTVTLLCIQKDNSLNPFLILSGVCHLNSFILRATSGTIIKLNSRKCEIITTVIFLCSYKLWQVARASNNSYLSFIHNKSSTVNLQPVIMIISKDPQRQEQPAFMIVLITQPSLLRY